MEYFVDNQTSPGKQGAYPAGVKDVGRFSVELLSNTENYIPECADGLS